ISSTSWGRLADSFLAGTITESTFPDSRSGLPPAETVDHPIGPGRWDGSCRIVDMPLASLPTASALVGERLSWCRPVTKLCSRSPRPSIPKHGYLKSGVLPPNEANLPRSHAPAWECSPRRSASLRAGEMRPQSGQYGIPTQDRGNEEFPP